MSDSEFYEVLLLAMSDMDTQFQFWLSITSAFIISIYVAGDKIGRYLKFGIILLYLASCWLILMRMMLNAAIVSDLLTHKPIDIFNTGITGTTGLFKEIVFFGGTLGATLFALLRNKVLPKNTEIPKITD